MELTELQRRVLAAAAAGGGRLIYWVLSDGRAVLPRFDENVAGAIQALEGAGLLGPLGPDGAPARALQPRSKGSYVMRLSESGARELARV